MCPARLTRLLTAAAIIAAPSNGEIGAQQSKIEAEFDSDGTRIHYAQWGSGEPVFMLHGLLGHGEVWGTTGVIDSLAQDFQVVAMDIRGHGRSAKPHDPADYGIEVIRDVLRLMDHLELETANFVGYSLGGYLTMYFVAMFPDRVTRAVVAGAGMMIEGDGAHDLFAHLADLFESMEPGQSITDMFLDADLDEADRRRVDANDAAAMSAISRGMLSLTLEPSALAENPVPVLLLIGEHDSEMPRSEAALLLGSGMEMHILPGRDHLTALFDPEFARVTRAFLNR